MRVVVRQGFYCSRTCATLATDVILEWTTSLYTSSRALFVCPRHVKCRVTYHVRLLWNVELRNYVRLLLNVELRNYVISRQIDI